MAETFLRTYVQEIDDLIAHEQGDEAIAHCRHILGFYPKHVDTYRLLAKALLASGRQSDAADVFQRVLSAIPDDFISHVGMAEIRADEGNLEAAIWHLERAFEVNPASPPIQEELRRLIGRRDGREPPKVHLTRGGLARMYLKGDRARQAIAEVRMALGEAPDRLDLLLVLAEALWRDEQKAEAAENCARILEQLPYCRDANRILAAIWSASGRPDEARVYQDRVVALDPYESFVDPALDGREAVLSVEPQAVRIPKLEYIPGQAADRAEGAPDWMRSLRLSLGPEAQPAESVPDWLQEPGAAEAAVTEAVDDMPDWLKAIGAVPFDSAAPAVEAELEPEPLAETSAPDWLAGLRAASESAPPDWLTDEEATAGAGVATAPQPPPPQPTAPEAAPPVPEAEIPDWMRDLSIERPPAEMHPPLPAGPAAGEIPDWLRSETAHGKSFDTAHGEPFDAAQGRPFDTAHGEPFDAAQGRPSDREQDERPTEAPSPEEPYIPDWLKSAMGAPSHQAQEARAEEPPLARAEVPDWLRALAPEEATPAGTGAVPAPPPAAPVGAEPGGQPPRAEADSWDEATLDWLERFKEQRETPEETALPARDEEPEWLRSVTGPPAGEGERLRPEASSRGSARGAQPEEAVGQEEPAAPEEPATGEPPRARKPSGEPPEWLRTPAEYMPSPAEGPFREQPTEVAPPAAEPSPAGAGEVPAWLREALEEGTAAPAASEDLSWLDTLAAAQPAPSEGFVTGPSTAPSPFKETGPPTPPPPLPPAPFGEQEEPEVWVSPEAEADQIEAAAEELAPAAEVTAQAAVLGGSFPAPGTARRAWMPEQLPAEEPVPPPSAPSVTLPPVEVRWPEKGFAPPVAEAPTTEAPTPGSEDEALRWLESLAARQGAEEEELVTRPEERTETLPEWLRAEVAAAAAPEAPAVPAAPPEETGAAMPAQPQAEPEAAPAISEPEAPVPPAPGEALEFEAPWMTAAAPLPAEAAPEAEPLPAAPSMLEEIAGPPAEAALAPEQEAEVAPPVAEAVQPAAPAEAPTPPVGAFGVEVHVEAPVVPPAPARERPPAPRRPEAPAPDEMLATARDWLDAGKTAEALALYADLVKGSRALENVIADLERQSSVEPPSASLLRTLGDAYMRSNRLQQALDAYRLALGRL